MTGATECRFEAAPTDAAVRAHTAALAAAGHVGTLPARRAPRASPRPARHARREGGRRTDGGTACRRGFHGRAHGRACPRHRIAPIDPARHHGAPAGTPTSRRPRRYALASAHGPCTWAHGLRP